MAKDTFKLTVGGAGHTVPLLLVASGQSCGGEFAYIARPPLGKALLVMAHGKAAKLWEHGERRDDAPQLPSIPVDYKEGVARVQAMRRMVVEGPRIELRDQWRGTLSCAGGKPVVTLVRKLTSYGTLVISSSPVDGRWGWHYEGKATWFQPGMERSEHIGPYADLASAILDGVDSVTSGPVAEACSRRDTHRRASFDPTWEATHPVVVPEPKRDPGEAWVRRHAGAQELPPTEEIESVESGWGLVPVVREQDVATVAQEIVDEAQVLIDQGPDWIQRGADRDPPDLEGVGAKLDAWGYRAAAGALRGGMEWWPKDTRLRSNVWGPDSSPETWSAFMADVYESARNDHADLHEPEVPFDGSTAAVLLGDLDGHYKGAPYLFQRTRNLIRYAAGLSNNARCQGPEAEDARLVLQAAVREYETQRRAYLADGVVDVRAMRQAAESAALSAAKSMSACGAGQLSILSRLRAPPVTGTAQDIEDARIRPSGLEYIGDYDAEPSPTAEGHGSGLQEVDGSAPPGCDACAARSNPWVTYLHDDEAPESEPIDDPSPELLELLDRGGLTWDPNAGTFLGRTTAPFQVYPAGSLVYTEPTGQQWSIARPLVYDEPSTLEPGDTSPPGPPDLSPRGELDVSPEDLRDVSPRAQDDGSRVDAAKDAALQAAILDAVRQALAGGV